MNNEQVQYGIVKVRCGKHNGRIVYYDDDQDKSAIVYFGDPLYSEWDTIPLRYIAPVTVPDLINRHEDIVRRLMDTTILARRAELLGELLLVEEVLNHRMLVARLSSGGKRDVFISHSSRDRQFATWLAVELANAGHSPWLDEWKIKVGESIPLKVSEGIMNCHALVVVLSPNAVASRWVENEWQAKYWYEVSQGRVMVLPVLLEKCEIPTLLSAKKYADFTENYEKGLESLLIALKGDS